MIAALALAALVLIVPAWPGTLPTSVIPDGARWVAHLDVEKFVATKLYEYLEKDGRLQIKSRDIGRWLKIDEIPYGSYTLYLTGSDEFGAFLNDGLIVFSENREAVEKVLDTAAGKTKSFASSKLNAAFKDVSSGTFLSGVVEDLSGLGKEISQSKFVEKASMMFFLAQEKQDNLQVRVQVTADSPESAKNMADMAQGLIALVRLGQGEGPGAIPASLVEGLRVKLEGKTVRLELDMPSREVANLASRGRGLDFFD